MNTVRNFTALAAVLGMVITARLAWESHQSAEETARIRTIAARDTPLLAEILAVGSTSSRPDSEQYVLELQRNVSYRGELIGRLAETNPRYHASDVMRLTSLLEDENEYVRHEAVLTKAVMELAFRIQVFDSDSRAGEAAVAQCKAGNANPFSQSRWEREIANHVIASPLPSDYALVAYDYHKHSGVALKRTFGAVNTQLDATIHALEAASDHQLLYPASLLGMRDTVGGFAQKKLYYQGLTSRLNDVGNRYHLAQWPSSDEEQ